MGKQQKVSQTEQDLNHVLKARREELAELQAAGKDPFQITKHDVTVHSMDMRDSYQQREGKGTVIAEHMMFKHVMGKASFCNVQDLQGTIQVYAAGDSVGEEPYKDFKKTDIGDIVGVRGIMLTTKTGETSVHATKVTLLTRSLQVLPEKFHGLTDTDTRYYQRYMDLTMNAEVKNTFTRRSKVISAIRIHLGDQGFMETETPMLVTNIGGVVVRPFEIHFNASDKDLKIHISLELYLRKLVVDGLERVCEIGRVFRNEELNTRHNPEFTLMELHQTYTDYNGVVELMENLYHHVARAVLGITTITYKGVGMNPGWLFTRITMVEAIKKYAGVDPDEIHTLKEARAIVKEKGVEFGTHHKKGDILNLFFEEFAGEHLVQSTLVLDHPVEISPLAKKKPGNPDYVERFEFFMSGWGMANTYSEINGPTDQREHFKAQEEFLAQKDEEVNHTDGDPLSALEVGIPSTEGIGFGIDRIVMLLTNLPVIRGVLLFLTTKAIGNGEPSKRAEKTGATAELSVKTRETAASIDFSKVKIEPLFEGMVDFGISMKSDYRAVKVKNCVAVPKSKKLLQFTLDDGSGTNHAILNGVREHYEPEQLIGKMAIVIVNPSPRKMVGVDSCGILIPAVHEEGGHESLNLLMADDQIPAGVKLYQSVFENSFSPSALRNPPDSAQYPSEQSVPRLAAYSAPIQLAQPATPPSSGPNLPQNITHSRRKVVFRHTLVLHGFWSDEALDVKIQEIDI